MLFSDDTISNEIKQILYSRYKTPKVFENEYYMVYSRDALEDESKVFDVIKRGDIYGYIYAYE